MADAAESAEPGQPAEHFVAPNAQVVGDVQLGHLASIWYGSIVRGEHAPVEIDASSNVQDNCIVESTAGHPVHIGSGVSLGHNARVYGATIEARSLIAIGATVLEGAVIGSQSIVGANATVPENMVVPPRTLVVGQGRLARAVTDAEIERIDRGARSYARLTGIYAAAQ